MVLFGMITHGEGDKRPGRTFCPVQVYLGTTGIEVACEPILDLMYCKRPLANLFLDLAEIIALYTINGLEKAILVGVGCAVPKKDSVGAPAQIGHD